MVFPGDLPGYCHLYTEDIAWYTGTMPEVAEPEVDLQRTQHFGWLYQGEENNSAPKLTSQCVLPSFYARLIIKLHNPEVKQMHAIRECSSNKQLSS